MTEECKPHIKLVLYNLEIIQIKKVRSIRQQDRCHLDHVSLKQLNLLIAYLTLESVTIILASHQCVRVTLGQEQFLVWVMMRCVCSQESLFPVIASGCFLLYLYMLLLVPVDCEEDCVVLCPTCCSLAVSLKLCYFQYCSKVCCLDTCIPLGIKTTELHSMTSSV